VQGSAGKRNIGPEKQQIAGTERQKALPLPKRGSPAQALIEIILWLRLEEGVARKVLFLEKDGSAVSSSHDGSPRTGAICAGVAGSLMWLRIRCTGAASVTKAMIRISVPQVGQVRGNAS
jgi:hypothetical protein